MQYVFGNYAWDPLAPLYFLAAAGAFAFGAGLLLYERFTGISRRTFLLTTITAGWLAPLGMAALAADAATAELWLRVAFVVDPLTAPALLWLSSGLIGRKRLPAQRPAWAAGATFTAIGVAGPWLVEGLETVTGRYTLAGWGWLGALYFVYVAAIVAVAVVELARWGAAGVTPKDRQEAVLLAVTAGTGALTLLDYWAAEDPFRVGLLTPLAILAAIIMAGFVTTRYRAFSLARTFGTDEVLRTMSDVVLVCDTSGRIRGSNPAGRRLLGRTEEELQDVDVEDLFAPRDGRPVDGWPLTGDGTRRDLDLALIRPDGGQVAVSVATEPLRTGSRAVGLVIVARDIGDRLKAERALRASERRYRSMFWNNPTSVYEFDLDGRVVAANPAVTELLGLPVAELLGRPFVEIIAPDFVDEAMEVFRTALDGQAREYELAVVHAGGDVRRIRGVAMPIHGDTGDVLGVSGVALDITGAARVKRELEVQRQYFADLFETSPEGIVLVEARTDVVIRVNEEFTRLFGYTAEEAAGRNLNDLIVPEDRKDEGIRMNRAAREDGRVWTETVRQRKDGSLVEVSVLARNLEIPGEPQQLYGVYRDISDRKETERALREREEELRHAQKLEAVGKLAGGIAHDFNNLLTVINGHARFALDGLEEGSALEADMLEIEKAGVRAAALTQQLLAYSRRQVLHPQILDPNVVVLETHGMLRRVIGEHIKVETHLTPDDVRVRADRGQLEQVLMNLVVNARDAMPEGGTLTLETELITLEPGDPRTTRWEVAAGTFVRIGVADTGVGMDQDTLAQAFEPFFTTKELGKGTGLGLATVFGIVKQSGGHVEARSRMGEGTSCDVFLPRIRADVPRATAEGREETDRTEGGVVLLAEDEAAVRKLAARVLEREGFTVLAAENGARALELIEGRESELDLVVTDLVMPDLGGRELAQRLRSRVPDIPVLFMSGYDEELIADGGTSQEFLAKPFTPAELASRVVEALRTARGP